MKHHHIFKLRRKINVVVIFSAVHLFICEATPYLSEAHNIPCVLARKILFKVQENASLGS